ncbi:MAG: phosphotransferase [Anaerolineales bacterium]|nr:phosphotransferase [Anaerolineales bacterium]
MEQIQVSRSFVDGDALAKVIEQVYDLGELDTCRLFSKMLRSQDNDHYKIITKSGDPYVARVYQQGEHLERQQSDYEYELDWLNFLKENDLPISYPIRRRDGGFLGSVLAPEGLRYYALFSFAQGTNLSVNDHDQLFLTGQNMAKIHLVSNDYQSSYARQPLDLDYLINKPVERIHHYWRNKPSKAQQLDLLELAAEEATAELESLFENPDHTEDGWGPIGGDFHTASTYFDENNNPTFFNFDLCGPGWRAYDIATFLLNTDLMHQHSADASESFFAGYYSIRPLSQNEHEAISPFLTVRRIWLTSVFTITQGLAGHTFIASA